MLNEQKTFMITTLDIIKDNMYIIHKNFIYFFERIKKINYTLKNLVKFHNLLFDKLKLFASISDGLK